MFGWLLNYFNLNKRCSCGCEEESDGEFDFEGHPYSVIVGDRYYLADRYALIHGPEMSIEGAHVELDLDNGKIDARKFIHHPLEIVYNPDYNFGLDGLVNENNVDVV